MSVSDFERRLSVKTPVLSLQGQTLDLYRLRRLRSYLYDDENYETFYISDVALFDERLSAPDVSEGVVKNELEMAEWKRLVADIKRKLEANCNRFPSDFIHCLLSYHVYYDYVENNNEAKRDIVDVIFHKHHERKYNELLVDWKRAEIEDENGIKRIATRMNTKTDYLGVIYQNKKTKQVVLTHCGTNPRRLGTIEADFYGVILGNPIQEQTLDCYEMTKMAVEFCQQNKGYYLSITGHSLGAWLAELSIYFCHFDFDFKNVKVVNFESPGSYEQIESLMPNVLNRYSFFDEKSLNIVSYLARPNYVNTFNKHVGLVFELDAKINPDHYLKWERALIRLNRKLPNTITLIDSILSLRSHMLEYLLAEFDPLTGKARQVKKVYDWPCVKLNVIDTKLNSLINNNNHRYLKSKVIRMISPTFKRMYDLFKMVISWIGGSLDLNHHQLYKQLEYTKKASSGAKGFQPSEFKMSYKAHYSADELVDLSRDFLLHQDIGSPDYYLFLIYKADSAKLSRTSRLLSEIKGLYRLFMKNGKTFTIQTVKGVTVEYLRELMYRMLEVDPNMTSVLSEENTGMSNGALFNPVIIDDLGSIEERFFTGKSRTLNKMDAFLASNNSSFPNLLIISSIAGCGKSALANEYAKRLKRSSSNQTVVWFDASSIESIVRKFNEILAVDLTIGQQNLTRIVDDRVKLKLIVQNIKANISFKHLFIFDNIGIDQMEVIKDLLLMAPENLRIILTTREDSLNTCHGLRLNRLHLKPFTRSETIAYLTKRLSEKASPQTLDLLLDRYILDAGQAEFLPLRAANLARCLEYFFQIGQPHPSTFETISKVSARFSSQLTTRYLFECFLDETDKKDAFGLLKHLAFFDIKSISINLIKKVFVAKPEDVMVLDQSIRELENLSYVQKFYELGELKYKLPGVLQEELISYLKYKNEPADELAVAEEQETGAQDIRESLAEIVSFLVSRFNQALLEEAHLASQIRVHVLALVKQTNRFRIEDRGLLRLSDSLSNLINTSQPRTSSRISEREHHVKIVIPQQPVARRRSSSVKSQDSPDLNLAVSYFNSGNECYFKREYEQAIEYINKALQIARRESETSSFVASLLTNLGNSYNALGDQTKAIELHSRAIGIKIKNLKGPNECTLDLAKAFNNLGAAQYMNQMLDDALVSYSKSIDMMLRLNENGSLNAELSSTCCNLALVYQSKKEFQRSIEFFEESLRLEKQIATRPAGLMIDHMMLFKNLAISYHSVRNFSKAIENYRKSLDMLKRRSNPQDSSLQVAIQGMADKAMRMQTLS